MKEIACQFGEFGRLNGIITKVGESGPSSTAMILITAGLTAKTGPFRLYTQIAREASKIGMTSLRFDLGGIGNSEEVHPGIPLSKRTELDIKQAVNYLASHYNIKHFVLGGLCSGAEDSLRYAATDSRVTGVFLIDGHAYRTKMWWLKNVMSTRYVIRCVGKILRAFGLFDYVAKSPKRTALDGDSTGLIDYKQMEISESQKALEILTNRNTKLHYIYTLGLSNRFNHKKQFYRMFESIDFKNLATVSYLSDLSHVQLFEHERNQMVKAICSWLGSNFRREKQVA